MSIRFRLALLYTAILALTLIIFSVALYATVSRVTHDVVEAALASEAERLLDEGFIVFPRIVILPAGQVTAPQTYVQTRRLSGEVTDRTANLGEFKLPLSEVGLATVQAGEGWVETAPTGNGRLLIYSKPVKLRDRVVGVLQLARSLVDQDQALQTLKRMLTIVGGIATLLAFAMGWLMARVTLRPIDRITHAALAIGADRDFSRRVHYSGPRDEIGRLATTFNAMLTELEGTYHQVEQALQAQRRFVADASHELRTPLTTIRGNAALLQREPPIGTEDRDAALADMVEESERMNRLVNDLLALARADVRPDLQREAVPIQPLIDEVCRQMRFANQGRRIDCLPGPDVAVMGDRDALRQILLILLDNAVKWTPLVGDITVSCAAHEGNVMISVRDTGSGIEPTQIPYIFDRFYRGDTARAGAGAGLGLSIAKALVEAQQGRLRVESTLHQGSVFTITLPMAALPSEPAGVREAPRTR